GVAATTRVYDIIDKTVRVQEPVSPVSGARPHRKITFSDVCYQYSSGPKVLQGMNFEIQHGETIAVVGPNGSGK
ncbi:MAG: ABC transporter ATP-binding protein, partial [Rubripirellula sp.]